MSEYLLAVGLIVIGVALSAFMSGTEVALFSLRRVEREQMGASDVAADRRVVEMLRDPRQLIGTVLLVNEFLSGMVVVGAWLLVSRIMPTATLSVRAVCAIGMALPVIVLLGEVTPKAYASAAPRAWARITALPLRLLVLAVAPVRLLLQGAVDILARLVGAPARTLGKPGLSQAEFRSLVDAGSAQGQVNARERRIIHKVFEFSDKNVGQIMTPRERIFALAFDLPMGRLCKEIAARGFSRVPIYQKNLDNIRGIVNAKDLVKCVPSKPGQGLSELLHEPLFVPRTTPVKRLFLTFKQRQVHMALVVNEYGKVLGLVTMDDVLGQIFGVLRDERERQQLGRRGTRTPPLGTPVATGEQPRVATAPLADSAAGAPALDANASSPPLEETGVDTESVFTSEAPSGLLSLGNTGIADLRRNAALVEFEDANDAPSAGDPPTATGRRRRVTPGRSST